MHISRVHVEKFRLFNKLSVDLNAGLNVIVGENNSGKTALIDAIRLTLDTNSAEWTRISDFDFHENEDAFSIKLKFDEITPEQAHVFVEHLTHEEIEGGTRKSVLYVNLIAQRTDIVRRGSRYIRTEFRSGENAEGPQIEREIRDYLSATYLKPLRDAEAELSAGRSSRLSQILSSSKAFDREGDNFKSLLEGLINASKDAKDNNGLKENREEIYNHFENLTFENDEFDLAIQLLGSKDFNLLSKVEKERSFQDILQRLSLTLDESKPLQGLGYNNALFMATELILLEQEYGEFPLLLIEEPEAHLHPQLQMKLLKFIREEYSSEENPKIQTIISTHSPNLASKAPLESIILMKEGRAFPMRKGETGLANDDYVFLEKFLDVTKSNLFFAKSVLIVEGDGENILLPTISKLLGRPLEDYGVSIVNVGNTAYARYAKIFLRKDKDSSDHEWLPIRVACLRDLDLWPVKADMKKYPAVGFKQRKEPGDTGKGGNLSYWLDVTTTDEKKVLLKELEAQKVRVLISDEWTFEYCLIRSGLGKEIYTVINSSGDGYDDLPADEEERAIMIYGMVDNKAAGKTEVAYQLNEKLNEMFGEKGKKEALRALLPQYILDSIEYVTKKYSLNLDTEQVNQAVEANQLADIIAEPDEHANE
jgi:putative ATP-dependent endonuclease of OLD family